MPCSEAGLLHRGRAGEWDDVCVDDAIDAPKELMTHRLELAGIGEDATRR